ncbi:hypothetical protein CVU83_01945, partial [Candidatus Falkowbacteria bacterium HGW-Falkowbacteria-2]
WSGTDYDFVQPRNFELLMWGWSAPIQSWPGRLRDVFHSDHKNVGTLNIQSYGYYAENVHNDFLQIAVETGLLGLLAFISVWLVPLKRPCIWMYSSIFVGWKFLLILEPLNLPFWYSRSGYKPV